MFALKCEHVRFLQDFIAWPKCLKTGMTKTEKTRDWNSPDRKVAYFTGGLLHQCQLLGWFSKVLDMLQSNLHRGWFSQETKNTGCSQKWGQYKAHASSQQLLYPSHWCPSCGRGFNGQFGLISYLRSHAQKKTWTRLVGHVW